MLCTAAFNIYNMIRIPTGLSVLQGVLVCPTHMQMDTLTMERAALVEIGRVYVMHVIQINNIKIKF